MFDKIVKWCKIAVLSIWGVVLAASIYGAATGGTPWQMGWVDIICREGTIVSLALAEVLRDNTYLF